MTPIATTAATPRETALFSSVSASGVIAVIGVIHAHRDFRRGWSSEHRMRSGVTRQGSGVIHPQEEAATP